MHTSRWVRIPAARRCLPRVAPMMPAAQHGQSQAQGHAQKVQLFQIG